MRHLIRITPSDDFSKQALSFPPLCTQTGSPGRTGNPSLFPLRKGEVRGLFKKDSGQAGMTSISICFLPFIFCLLALVLFGTASANVKDTKHNLSVSGPGTIKAVSETQTCIFCHTPHNSHPVTPLWNHDLSAVTNYVNYWSPTLQAYSSEAGAPQIDGFSKLCLGCHDGTIALGAIASRQEDIQMVTIATVVEAGVLQPGAGGYLGTDLSGGHPISFIFDEALANKRNSQPGLSKLKWPVNDGDVKLYPTQGGYGLQCSSCHDPHGSKAGPSGPPLWRKATYDEVCDVCHEAIDFIGH